jgi:hypothetical protein
MKRRVRERVVGVSVEDEGEEVDGAGRELIVVAVGRSLALVGSKSVTEGCHSVTRVSHENGCASVEFLFEGSQRKVEPPREFVLSDRSCLVLRGCGMAMCKCF